MKNVVLVLYVAWFWFSSNGQPIPRSAPPRIPPPAQLPIRRVVLYSNGVVYIERRGVVTGNVGINLSFKQSQVDDVLKSLIVLDLGKGQIGAVSYNSSEPGSSRMAEIPFSVNPVSGDGQGISSVLSQLQGARVAVTSDKGTTTGSILTIERKQVTDDKGARISSVLVIGSETGEISSFDLSEVRSIRLLDDATRRDIKEFANATASARRVDAKTITVTSNGTGQREMVVSYTIAAPIWKTTYRVVLDKDGKPFFQGWAIVDNVSDESWENVQMSLVSGSPISFIQNLQNPFYRYRPVVPMPSDLKLRPQTYEQQSPVNRRVSGSKDKDLDALPDDPDERAAALQALVGAQAGPNGGQIYIDGFTGGRLAISDTDANKDVTVLSQTVSAALLGGASGVQTAATGDDIGDLFEYRIEHAVTVERDRSALIPIVQTKMEGERVSVYNEAVRADRPYGGMMLKNTSGLTIESGSMTVLDGDAYAGEALLERLKPDEKRLISFALDLGTRIVVRRDSAHEPARMIKAANGVLKVEHLQSEHLSYKIINQTERPRVVYVEYPLRPGWELSPDTAKPEADTQNFYRFRVELGPGEQKELKIGVGQPVTESYQLSTLSRSDLESLTLRGPLDQNTRAALEDLIDLRFHIGEINSKIEAGSSEESSIGADQSRFRENIESLSKTPEAKALIERYIAKANEQETRLEQIQRDKAALRAEKLSVETQLATRLKTFELK